jgi:hypothetical protein
MFYNPSFFFCTLLQQHELLDMVYNKQKDLEINKKDVENDDNQEIKKIKSKWKSTILIPNFPFPLFGKENKPLMLVHEHTATQRDLKAKERHTKTNIQNPNAIIRFNGFIPTKGQSNTQLYKL